MIRTMKIIRNLTLLAMLLLPLGARADVVNVSSPGNFAVKTLHSNSAVVYCYSLTDGTYKLQNDVSMDAHIHIPSGKTVTIDLNNHTLSRGLASAHGWGFVIYNEGGNLTITDSSNEKGGIITGGYNDGEGSGIYNYSGTLTIEGGTFSGNHAASNGGAIYIKTGTLNLKGGTITNNIATYQGGGIYVESGQTMNMQGAPTITGNRVGGSDNNLFLSNNVVINIGTGGLNGSVGSIGVTKDSPGLITTALDNATRYQIFVSDKNNCETTNVVDNTENKAYYQTCWMGLANQMNVGGSISLDAAKVYEAYSTDPCLTVPSGKTVNLDLKELTLNRGKSSAEPDGCAIKVENGGTLTISGSGTIKGGNNSSGGGGIQNLGTLTINGGTIRENTSTSWGGGIHNEGTLNISGGIIEQNTASGCNGGGIHNTGTLNITGGTIRNNSATLGAGIYHDGATFSLQGAPDISGNASKNVYLTAAHPTITINGDLGNSTAIGITMETLGVFTSGLSTHGSINNFSSEADNSVALVANNGEAELITCWNYLKRQLAAGVSPITLASGTYRSTGSSDDYLHVPSDKTVVLNLNGQTLNRNLSSATNDGCVIYNEGNLTVNGSGTITGGKNSDLGTTKGGGICNTGTLTITGGTISNNTTAQYGGGIYNIGDLRIQGGTNNSNTSSGDAAANGLYHNGTSLSIEGAPVVNIYLATTKTLTIPSPLTNSSADHIKIACADEHLVFTPGVDTSAYKDKFSSNQTSKGIGFNSSGNAMIGTKYTITRSNVSAQEFAIRDERVAVTVSASSGYIPITLNYTDEAQNVTSLSSYPENSATYYFDMPAKNISVTATCYQGGYCGAGDEKKMKYYLQEGTLKFITDGTNCAMENYAASAVPWRGFTYSAIDLSSNVKSISDYAFAKVDNYGKFVANTSLATVSIPSTITSIGTKAFFNCTALAAIIVDPGNPNYSAANGVLFNKAGTELICYPAGKQEDEANNYTYTMSNSVTSVAEGAFAFNTHLKGIAVESGGSSFKGVDGVLYNAAETSLICYPAGKEGDLYTVASSVTSIGAYAFQSCTALRNLYVLRSTEEGGITAGGACMLDGTHSSLKILVKSGSVDAYKGDANWSAYRDKIFAMDLSNSITITLDSSEPFDYTGSAITPTITVRDIVGTILVIGTDYTVAYGDNIAVGTGHITVTGQGNYTGSKTIDFYITRNVSFLNSTKDYATYYSNEDLEIMSGGKAYVITGVDWTTGDITTVQVDYIKAQTPVILYKSGIGNAGNNPYHLKARTGTSAYTGLYENFLGKLSVTNYDDLKTSGISDIYVLRGSSFARVSTSGSLPANRCYLARPSAAGTRGIDSLSLEGGGNDATSLIEVNDEEKNNNEWYTLDGRKLQGKPTKKGVYVSKGKKIVVH